MPVPDYQTLMLPVLKLMAGGKTNVRDCLEDLKVQFGISEEEAEELLPSGRTTYLANRAHWARTYMSKAGLLVSPRRGVHELTDTGRQFLAGNPTELNNNTLAQFADFQNWKEKTADETSPRETSSLDSLATIDTQTPEDTIAASHRFLNSALKDDLLSELHRLSPANFEILILDLLSAMGFGGGRLSNKVLTPIAGDGGIDGIINEDALGLDAVYIQAKRYASDNKVGRPDIQRFVGSLTGESATKGVFVTTSDFSRGAREYIDRVQQRVVLINGQELSQLMIEHDIGVRTRSVFRIKSIDEDYFSQ